MATKRLPRPRDPIQLAKLIGDIATGQVVDAVDDGKNPAAAALGRVGGLKGGRVRAENLTAEQRTKIARAAAKARYAKK
jgi:ubiquinone biosynthesis protein UbiJ